MKNDENKTKLIFEKLNERNFKVVEQNGMKKLYGGMEPSRRSKYKKESVTATPYGRDFEKEKTIDTP